MKTKQTTLALVLIAALAISACVHQPQYVNDGDFSVKRKGSGIVITEYLGSETEVVIPLRIGNLPVTRIGDSAFRNCASLTSVTMPNIRKTTRFT